MHHGEMDIKMEIKQEPCFPNICSENGREIYSNDHLMEVKNKSATCNSDNKMDRKTEIKEESFVLEFCSQNKRDILAQGLVRKDSEIVRSDNVCEINTITEIKREAVGANFTYEKELFSKDSVIAVNEYNKQYEIDKIELKEEQCLESSSRGVSFIYDAIKDGSVDNLPLTKSPRLCEGVPSDRLGLNSNENFGRDKDRNMKNDSVERVFTEQLEDGKMYRSISCLKQNSFILQSNSHKHSDCKKNIYKDIAIGEFKCNICENTCTSPSYLKLHKFIHEDRSPHKCDTCEKCFTQLSKLRKHKLIHEGIRPHKCDTCGKCFSRLSNLKIHKLIHEGKKPHKCETCGKCFTTLGNLKTHKVIHGGIKPHKCDICGKGFADLSYLRRHRFIHVGLKPHKCDNCGKGFINSSCLGRHKLIHEGTKPHKCDICGKDFIRLSHLRTHKLIHEGKKPHKCATCGKGFTKLSDLRRHKLIHEGTKPHKCDNCGKGFTQLSNLRRHKLIHEDT